MDGQLLQHIDTEAQQNCEVPLSLTEEN